MMAFGERVNSLGNFDLLDGVSWRTICCFLLRDAIKLDLFGSLALFLFHTMDRALCLAAGYHSVA